MSLERRLICDTKIEVQQRTSSAAGKAAEMAGLADGLPLTAIRVKTPRSLNANVPEVTAAERADTGRGAMAAGELSAEMFEQPSCWWSPMSPCTVTRSCRP
jgi:hypothetical protein